MSALPFALAVGLLAGQLPGVPPTTSQPSAAVEARPQATPDGPCATPRQAVVTWLANLQPDTYDEKKAAQCTLAPQGMQAGDVEKALVKLKKVLDARGIYVRVEHLPEDPDYKDPETGQQRVAVTSLLRDVYVIRTQKGWVLSPTTLAVTDTLYRETFPLDLARLVEELPSWMRLPVLGVAPWQVVALAVLLLLGFIARVLVANLITSQVKRLMERLKIQWGHELIHDSALPLGTLAMAGVVAVGAPSLALGVTVAQVVMLGVRTLAAVSIVMLIYRAVDLLAAFLAHRASGTHTKLDDQLVPLVRRGLKIVTVVLGIIFVLQNLEVNVGSLLATLGIGSLAFALAAKDTVGNLFGSITIFLDKPFQIGDWVVTSGVEGIVEEVGFRSTRIRTFYNSVVTIPNGKFTDAIVDNYGLRKYRRCFVTLSLTYETTPEQMEAFCDGVRAIIAAHPQTRKDYYEVHFSGYGESGLSVMLYFFFEVDSWSKELRARHEVFLDVWRLAHKLGVSFAFPTRTLHLETQAAPAARPPRVAPDVETLKDVVDAFGPGGREVVPPGQRVHPGFYAKV